MNPGSRPVPNGTHAQPNADDIARQVIVALKEDAELLGRLADEISKRVTHRAWQKSRYYSARFVLDVLYARGISARVCDGVLRLSPGGKLTGSLRDAVTTYRDELVDIVGQR